MYIAVTTGFCGSFTTFSRWQVQATQNFLRNEVFVGLLNLLVGISTFYCCFRFGRHVASLGKTFWASCCRTKPKNAKVVAPVQKANSTPPSWVRLENSIVACFGVALWIVCAILFIFVKRSREWTGAAFFSPAGVLIRWYLGLWNTSWPRFKLPTFSVNVAGAFIYAVLTICEFKYALNHSLLRDFLVALMSGFCGSLSTVSTFMLELHHMEHIHYSYIYGFASIAVAQSLTIPTISIAKYAFGISAL